MNLSAYDRIPDFIDKQKTWTDISRKLILSREIKYRPYVCLSKRFNTTNRITDYFVILLDDPPSDRQSSRTTIDNYGRIKIRLNTIWKDTILHTFKKDTNISIEHIEHTDDGDIYYLDI